ncbi:MAG: 50S ribosomal protein L24 [Spirochaetales bacterium]|uniref:Large ribosomal subunit protein uL24 n=1 Tax=Candidatus Thalassospirochaeta sargassi TaxID=3119039 RepID=A0AAJ1MPP1_9SPIO|nr:50S ribosomal protein L24 [Spirochaetales bacterium]
MGTKIKKDDTVKVVCGKDKGKTGKVVKVDAENGRIIIQGVNIVKKAQKPKSQNDKGGIISIEAAMDISNVKVICKKCGPTRIGYKIDGKEKTRICKKCGDTI